MNGGDWPRMNGDTLQFACCVSSIGPACGHRNPPEVTDYSVALVDVSAPPVATERPETYTIWVCRDCLLVHANGECGERDSDLPEPLSLIRAVDGLAMGMGWEEHRETCEVRLTGGWEPDYECDCETDTFARTSCAGCGDWHHGERHAMTVFVEERAEAGTGVMGLPWAVPGEPIPGRSGSGCHPHRVDLWRGDATEG